MGETEISTVRRWTDEHDSVDFPIFQVKTPGTIPLRNLEFFGFKLPETVLLKPFGVGMNALGQITAEQLYRCYSKAKLTVLIDGKELLSAPLRQVPFGYGEDRSKSLQAPFLRPWTMEKDKTLKVAVDLGQKICFHENMSFCVALYCRATRKTEIAVNEILNQSKQS